MRVAQAGQEAAEVEVTVKPEDQRQGHATAEKRRQPTSEDSSDRLVRRKLFDRNSPVRVGRCRTLSIWTAGTLCSKNNLILMDMGYLEELSRRSTNGSKKFKSITDKGLLYGKNELAPANLNQTHPRYYVDK
jgi:hypothetical protein